MARLYDSSGNLIGGLSTAANAGSPGLPDQAGVPDQAPEAAAVSTNVEIPGLPDQAAVPPMPPPLNRRYGPEETIPGLECSYGTFAYSYAETPLDLHSPAQQSRRAGCHNPVETPDERHHCDDCGGDYCMVHAEPAAHDCEYVIQRRR